jgi:TonB family protein
VGGERDCGEEGFGGGTGKGVKKSFWKITSSRLLLKINKKDHTSEDRSSGVAELNFSILKDGAVICEKIVSSSGYEAFYLDALDIGALQLIKKMSPFAPILAELGVELVNITLPMMLKNGDILFFFLKFLTRSYDFFSLFFPYSLLYPCLSHNTSTSSHLFGANCSLAVFYDQIHLFFFISLF